MSGNIKKYLENMADRMPLEIISEETFSEISKVTSLFQDFAASEFIMETQLNAKEAEADFSFRVLSKEKDELIVALKGNSFSKLAKDETWQKIVKFVDFWPSKIKEIWLEMDYEECRQEVPHACFFFDGSQIKKEKSVDEKVLFKALEKLVDGDQLTLLWPNLIKAINKIPLDVGLFQIGVMLARHSDRVRVFTNELTKEQILAYLSANNWNGSLAKIEDIFKILNPYSDGRYILDFDINSEGISKKIGINFGLEKNENLKGFLQELSTHQLCNEGKKTGSLDWLGSQASFLGKDYGMTAIIQDISHFKLGYSPEEALKAKAYFRYHGVYLKDLFMVEKSNSIKVKQDLFKAIAKRSMIDFDYRQLCLNDSKKAIEEMAKSEFTQSKPIVFLEEEAEDLNPDEVAYILPPYLKPSWITAQK